MHLLRRRILLGLTLGVVFASTFIAPVSAVTTSDGGPTATYTYDAMSIDERVQSYILYYTVSQCLQKYHEISNDAIVNNRFDGTATFNASWYLDSSDGQMQCDNLVTRAVNLWQYPDLATALEDWGYNNPGNGKDWTQDHPGTTFIAAIKNRVYAGSNATLDNASKYAFFRKSLANACQLSDGINYSDANAGIQSELQKNPSTKYVRVTDVTGSPPNVKTVDMVYKIGKYLTATVGPSDPGFSSTVGGVLQDCGTLAANANKYAGDFATYANKNPDKVGDLLTSLTGSGSGSGDDKTSCAIDNIGWIICPVFNFMASVVDQTYGVLSSLLSIKALSTSTNDALYKAWRVMLGFANTSFVIAFLLIIYSQLTGAGITNYGLKKLLPKLIIAAVLVNASYWICAIAVDLSNILGSSLKSAFDQVGAQIKMPAFSSSSTGAGWTGLVGGILAGGAAATLLYLNIGALLIALPTVLLSVLVAFIIMIFRQALVIILIVLAPLAFVAYLLPNTESWFKKWRDFFQVMLLMYPIIAVIFGGSALASKIVMAAGTDSAGDGNFFVQIMGAIIAIVPLGATVFIVNMAQRAGGAMGRLVGFVNNPNRGPFDRMRKRAEATADRIKSNRDRRALESTNPFRNIPLVSRRRGMIGEMKRDARKKQRDAAYETLANTDTNRRGTGAADYKARTVMAQETAAKTGEVLQNQAKLQHLQQNGQLHTDAITSGLDLHNAEETHKNEATTHHMLDTANTAQYGELNASRGELKNAQLDVEHTYESSHRGRTIAAERQNLEDQLGTVKSQQVADYKNSGIGQVRSQERKTADKSAELAELANTNTYKQSSIGQTQGVAERNLKDIGSIADKATDQVYEAGAQGRRNAQQLKEAEGVLKITRGEAENTYNASQVGRGQAVQLDAISTQGNITAKQVEAEALEANRDLKLEHQLRSDELDAVKAEEGALVQELRTEEGAEKHPQYGVVAEGLRAADITKRAETQRTASASSIANQEYAQKVIADATMPMGGTTPIAVVAGGIAGTAGVSQAKAVAKQVNVEAFNKGVAAERTLVSQVPEGDILSTSIPDPNNPSGSIGLGLGSNDILDEPEERIAALASSIAGRQHQASHIKLWERMGELGRQADAELATATASGDQAAIDRAHAKISKVKSMQQQVMGDKKKTPFGIGDAAQGDANVGRYTGDIFESTRDRISTHISPQKLASMDPDDIRLIFEMARDGKLSDDERDKIVTAYNEWESDPILGKSLENKHRILLDPIRDGNYGGAPQDHRYDLSGLSNRTKK